MTDQQTPPLAENRIEPYTVEGLLRERESLDHELNLYAETIAKMAARVAELESIIMCEFSRERDGERCWCSEDHIHRMIRLGQHDGRCQAIRELNIPSAALLKPAEKPS